MQVSRVMLSEFAWLWRSEALDCTVSMSMKAIVWANLSMRCLVFVLHAVNDLHQPHFQPDGGQRRLAGR
jgi:hypothetical protein